MKKNKKEINKELRKRLAEIIEEIYRNSAQLVAQVARYADSYDIKTLQGKVVRTGMQIMDIIGDLEFEINSITKPK